MAHPLQDWKKFNLSEASQVVDVVEVVMSDRRYRIEVLKSYSDKKNPYSTRAYIEEDVTIQPRDRDEGFDKEPESIRRWIHDPLAQTSRLTPEGAVTQALGFLSDRSKKK